MLKKLTTNNANAENKDVVERAANACNTYNCYVICGKYDRELYTHTAVEIYIA